MIYYLVRKLTVRQIWVKYIIPLLLPLIFFIQCQPKKRFDSSVVQPDYDTELASDLLQTYSINEFIDEYAGHPYDPQLPVEFLGVTDDELSDIHPRDLQRLFSEGLEYALDNEVPRHLFALGRAAYFHDHPEATVLLEKAIEKGSVAAIAYIGYSLFDKSDLSAALKSMQKAYQNGFEDPELNNFIELTKENIFQPQKFNRPRYISALYSSDVTYLQSEPFSALYIGSIQNTLWANDILFIVDDPKILLELSPKISGREGRRVDNEISQMIQKWTQFFKGFSSTNNEANDKIIIIEQGIQDAKRLALLYEYNPKAFRKVYAGMKAYSGR